MASASERVSKGKDDAHHGDKRSNLDHCPGGPVEGDEIFSITELESKDGVGFHDDDDGRDRDTAKTHKDGLS